MSGKGGPVRNDHRRRPSGVGRPKGENGGGNSQADWQRHYDRYCQLAQNAFEADAVTREQYWQHAEHYRRLLNGSTA
jgi:hypothetical protein